MVPFQAPVVWFGGATVGWLVWGAQMGCIFWAKHWTIYPGTKNQPYHNQPSGASLCSVNRPWDETAALFVAKKIRGDIRRLGGVEGMGNW